MAKYNEGNTVIVNNKGTNQVGVILGSSIQHGTNKRTVYDILLETRSVIAAVPKGAVSKQVYIDDTLTESLINSGKIVTTIPYWELRMSEMLPAYREESSGPRSF
jgi:hypothetical protein|tara:strand:+ start:300 stop:614 length:315 start_codon:yes stop_codon:yes gene_type:complete